MFFISEINKFFIATSVLFEQTANLITFTRLFLTFTLCLNIAIVNIFGVKTNEIRIDIIDLRF